MVAAVTLAVVLLASIETLLLAAGAAEGAIVQLTHST